MEQELIFTNHVEETIDRLVQKANPDRLFILVDDNISLNVLPRLQSISKAVGAARLIIVSPGDRNKSLESLSYIWKDLSDHGATRHSLLINLGGGMITDMGSFAAATFKRGIKFINIPTTLLAAVDASVGGKTGINFNGLKNEIGVFRNAETVIISSIFFNTLPAEEIKSGYAEMLKHSLLSDAKTFHDLIKKDILELDPDSMLKLIKENVKVKSDIVEKDPTEKNLRKALNLGHTVGHAFESLAMKRNAPIPHGYAVAYGMVVELVLSTIKQQFPSETLRKFASYVYKNYRAFAFDCKDYDFLIQSMHHDKKNLSADKINCSLLKTVGHVILDCTVSEDEIRASLDIYREELMK